MSVLDWSLQQAGGDNAFIAANSAVIPLLKQIVWNTDTGKYCIGDGVTALSALTFYGGVSASGITTGTTTITSGTNTRVLYNNNGVVGEYAVTGTGTTAVLSTSPTFTTDITTPLIYGSAAGGGNLVLESTSNATKGRILLQGVGTNNISFQGLVGSLTTPTIYMGVASPSSTNYVLSCTGTQTNLNAFNDLRLRIQGATVQLNLLNKIEFTPAAATSDVSQTFYFSKGANTNQSATVERRTFWINTGARTWQTGNITTQREVYIDAPTYNFNSASTITNAYNLFVDSPVQGANATITNAYSFGTQGKAKFGGNIELTQTVTTESVVSDTTVTIVINGVTYKLLARA